MKISVVTTLYQSAPYVYDFYYAIQRNLLKLTSDYEIIFVNDGSPDGSLEKAVAIQRNDASVKVVDLARNFGQHKAIVEGLSHTTGALVFSLEADLEENPDWLLCFHSHMTENPECDVVYGVQEKRKGGYLERLFGALFYTLFNFITSTSMPANHVTARLMSRRYVLALLEYTERAFFLGGIYTLVGFRQDPFLINKLNTSSTTYTFAKKVHLLFEAITSFSTAPLKAVFYAGATIFLVSLLSSAYVLLGLYHGYLPGWASLFLSLWALSGLIMASIGIVGIYISKVMDEVKLRPRTTVRHIYATPAETLK